MYAFKTILALVAPLMVVANPLVIRNDPPTTCNNGSIQCCNDLQKAGDLQGLPAVLLSLLNLEIVADALVGVTCSPIVGSTKCESQTVCCTNNQFNGLINVGCTPININL